MTTRWLFALLWFAIYPELCAAAIPVFDCHLRNLPGYIAFDPASPDSTQAITVTVGKFPYVPVSVDTAISSNTIDIRLTVDYNGFDPQPEICAETALAPLSPGAYTVNLWLIDRGPPPSPPFLATSTTLQVGGGPGVLSGLWWNASESGWGVTLTQRRNIVFAAWYTYDAAGNPKWYVAPNCALPSDSETGSCTESLYEVNGPTFFGTQFVSAKANVAKVGTLTLAFTDANTGTLTYNLPGLARSVPIAREPLDVASPPPPINYTDLWWNPNESGWGAAITHQSSVMFLAWFVYDNAGNPIWYVAPDCRVTLLVNRCDGTVYQTTGPALATTFDPNQVHATRVGTASLTFTDGSNGILSYDVNGQIGSKAITRELF